MRDSFAVARSRSPASSAFGASATRPFPPGDGAETLARSGSVTRTMPLRSLARRSDRSVSSSGTEIRLPFVLGGAITWPSIATLRASAVELAPSASMSTAVEARHRLVISSSS